MTIPNQLCNGFMLCDNTSVTNILLAQAAHRTPTGSLAMCESEAKAQSTPAGTVINPLFATEI